MAQGGDIWVARLRGNPQESDIWGDVMGNVDSSLGFQSRRVDLDNPVFFRTLGFAIFPHACRHPDAAATGVKARPATWKWITPEYRECSRDPNSRHACVVGEIR